MSFEFNSVAFTRLVSVAQEPDLFVLFNDRFDNRTSSTHEFLKFQSFVLTLLFALKSGLFLLFIRCHDIIRSLVVFVQVA